MDKMDEVREQLKEAIRVKEYLQGQAGTLVAIAEEITRAFRKGKKVLIFGNGGSAADAQHIAAELSGRFYLDRDPLPAIALTTNTSALTAIANDYGYETVFLRQLKGLITEGDVAVGISTGGNSPNVVLAMEEAKRRGAITIALTGKGGGRLKKIAHHALCIPSKDTPRIQEAHITVGHILCYLVEQALFGGGKT